MPVYFPLQTAQSKPEQQAPRVSDLVARLRERGLVVSTAGDVSRTVAGLNSLAQASSAEFSFLANPKYGQQLLSTQAGCVALNQAAFDAYQAKVAQAGFIALITDQPYLAFAYTAQWFDELASITPRPAAQIHPTAVVSTDAQIGAGVYVGPLAVIEAGAVIGAGCMIGPGCVIGPGAVVGANSRLAANVALYHGVQIGARAIVHAGAVIGSDGFGFAPNPARGRGAYEKIPQLGRVVIGDDVEIGASTTIDRGALQDTVLGNGVKLDNQIQIGHNVVVGEHTAMAGCVGIAGSATIGARCTFGGGAIVLGHLSICDDAHVSAATTITSSITQPGQYTGLYPYELNKDWEQNAVSLRRLNQLRKQVRQLEKSLNGSNAGESNPS